MQRAFVEFVNQADKSKFEAKKALANLSEAQKSLIRYCGG